MKDTPRRNARQGSTPPSAAPDKSGRSKASRAKTPDSARAVAVRFATTTAPLVAKGSRGKVARPWLDSPIGLTKKSPRKNKNNHAAYGGQQHLRRTTTTTMRRQQTKSGIINSKRGLAISPRTRGNAIANSLASPGDFNLDTNNNESNDGVVVRGENDGFVSPAKRSSAEAALNAIARGVAARRKKRPLHAASDNGKEAVQISSGKRRKRKAANAANAKVRSMRESDEFDALGELDESDKIPYTKPGGRKKASSNNGLADDANKALSAGKTSQSASSAPKSNDPPVTLETFQPKGKNEERWFRNFQKWKKTSTLPTDGSAVVGCQTSSSSSAAAANISTPSSPLPKRWAQNQRSQYKLLKQDRKTSMTQDRVALLEVAGFCWELRKSTSRPKADSINNGPKADSREIMPSADDGGKTAASGADLTDGNAEEKGDGKPSATNPPDGTANGKGEKKSEAQETPSKPIDATAKQPGKSDKQNSSEKKKSRKSFRGKSHVSMPTRNGIDLEGLKNAILQVMIPAKPASTRDKDGGEKSAQKKSPPERKSPRKSLPTQFYHNLKSTTGPSDKEKDGGVRKKKKSSLSNDAASNGEETPRAVGEDKESAPTPAASSDGKPLSPSKKTTSAPASSLVSLSTGAVSKAKSDKKKPEGRKRKRRGRHSTSSLSALEVVAVKTSTKEGESGRPKAPASFNYKELEQQLSKKKKRPAKKKSEGGTAKKLSAKKARVKARTAASGKKRKDASATAKKPSNSSEESNVTSESSNEGEKDIKGKDEASSAMGDAPSPPSTPRVMKLPKCLSNATSSAKKGANDSPEPCVTQLLLSCLSGDSAERESQMSQPDPISMVERRAPYLLASRSLEDNADSSDTPSGPPSDLKTPEELIAVEQSSAVVVTNNAQTELSYHKLDNGQKTDMLPKLMAGVTIERAHKHNNESSEEMPAISSPKAKAIEEQHLTHEAIDEKISQRKKVANREVEPACANVNGNERDSTEMDFEDHVVKLKNAGEQKTTQLVALTKDSSQPSNETCDVYQKASSDDYDNARAQEKDSVQRGNAQAEPLASDKEEAGDSKAMKGNPSLAEVEEPSSNEKRPHPNMASNMKDNLVDQPILPQKGNVSTITEPQSTSDDEQINSWTCDVCQEATFDNYEEAAAHERDCLGKRNAEAGISTKKIEKSSRNKNNDPPTKGQEKLINKLERHMPKQANTTKINSPELNPLPREVKASTMSDSQPTSNDEEKETWTCDICQEATFEDYDEAVAHERDCAGIINARAKLSSSNKVDKAAETYEKRNNPLANESQKSAGKRVYLPNSSNLEANFAEEKPTTSEYRPDSDTIQASASSPNTLRASPLPLQASQVATRKASELATNQNSLLPTPVHNRYAVDEASLALFSPLSLTSPLQANNLYLKYNSQQAIQHSSREPMENIPCPPSELNGFPLGSSPAQPGRQATTSEETMPQGLENQSSLALFSQSPRLNAISFPVGAAHVNESQVILAEKQYEQKMAIVGRLELEAQRVTERMREIEQRMKDLDPSVMVDNAVDGSSTDQIKKHEANPQNKTYHSETKSSSVHKSHSWSHHQYEGSAEGEYSEEEHHSPKKRRKRHHHEPQHMHSGKRSSRRSDTFDEQSTKKVKVRSRSSHQEVGRTSRSSRYDDSEIHMESSARRSKKMDDHRTERYSAPAPERYYDERDSDGGFHSRRAKNRSKSSNRQRPSYPEGNPRADKRSDDINVLPRTKKRPKSSNRGLPSYPKGNPHADKHSDDDYDSPMTKKRSKSSSRGQPSYSGRKPHAYKHSDDDYDSPIINKRSKISIRGQPSYSKGKPHADERSGNDYDSPMTKRRSKSSDHGQPSYPEEMRRSSAALTRKSHSNRRKQIVRPKEELYANDASSRKPRAATLHARRRSEVHSEEEGLPPRKKIPSGRSLDRRSEREDVAGPAAFEDVDQTNAAVIDDPSGDEKDASNASTKPSIGFQKHGKPTKTDVAGESTAAPPVNNSNNGDNGGSTASRPQQQLQVNKPRDPLYWLAGGDNSSDDESWDFDGPMILPPPPL